jgi:sorting nexin-25
MHSPFSTQSVVLVAVLAILIPAIIRVVSSPLILLLLSPFLVVLIALACTVSTVFLGHLLDSKRPSSKNNLADASQPFRFSTPAAWQAVLTRSQWSQSSPQSLSPLCPESAEISTAINDIIALIVRDFVLTWYSEISTSPSFPAAVSTVLHDALERFLQRASSMDLAALIVKGILPKVTAHIDQFRHSEMALRGAGLERRLTQSEELDLLLASRYSSRGGGKLHPAIANLSTTFTKQTEEAHLKQLVDKALPFILPEKEAKSRALKIAVREVMTCAVLYPVMEMMADPDFWNQALDHIVSK